MKPSTRSPIWFLLATVPCLLVFSLPPYARGTAIRFDVKPVTSVGPTLCMSGKATCKTTAYFDSTSLDTQNSDDWSALFFDAFTAWNNSATGGNNKWTLLGPTGVTNPGGDFNIGGYPAGTAARATQTSRNGGANIYVTLQDLTIPALNGGILVWVQGLYDNFNLKGAIIAPTYELDITPAGRKCNNKTVYCPPAYPFQYADNHFSDRPNAPYNPPGMTQAFFDANAYLAIENTTTDTLQLLDGVSYGFQNYVAATPEPGSLLLLGSGLMAMVFVIRRKEEQRVT